VELVVASYVLSAEHAENVPARLNATTATRAVKTSLHFREAPLANTGRYDK